MKYFWYSSNFEVDCDSVREYITDADSNNEVFKLCFDESHKDDFFAASKADWRFPLGVSVYFIGEDSYYYEFKPDGSVIKSHQCTDKMHKQMQRSRIKTAERIRKDKLFSHNIAEKYNNEVNFISKSVSGFDKYIFVNPSKSYVIPFRFRKANNPDAPLLIYFHGAGCIGHDNFKPLFEYKNFLFSKHIPDCNILITQALTGANYKNSNIKDYVRNCAHLINNLIQSNSIDKNRVYCFGTSFGACCVWYSISMFPEMFAAAVPVMGIMTELDEFLPILKEHNTLPIWIAHSSDDDTVSIATDDYIYSKLSDINPNIKYSRWDKYGHKMAGHFYRKEPFIEWMFEHSLDRKSE